MISFNSDLFIQGRGKWNILSITYTRGLLAVHLLCWTLRIDVMGKKLGLWPLISLRKDNW
jgi:hypothetical protein